MGLFSEERTVYRRGRDFFISATVVVCATEVRKSCSSSFAVMVWAMEQVFRIILLSRCIVVNFPLFPTGIQISFQYSLYEGCLIILLEGRVPTFSKGNGGTLGANRSGKLN